MAEIVVDTDRCQGHGRCALLAPDHFDVDDLGKAVLLAATVTGDEIAEVDEAVLSCPEGALSLQR